MQVMCPRCHTVIQGPTPPRCPHCGETFTMPILPGQAVTASLPSRWPTILVTFFFGIFGLIPAAVAARTAESRGGRGGRYWGAFGVTLLASAVAYLLAYLLIFAGLLATLGLVSKNTVDAGSPASSFSTPTSTAATSNPARIATTTAQQTSQARTTVTTTVVETTQTSTTKVTQRSAQEQAIEEASTWPAYDYVGPYNLCVMATFPEPAGLIFHPGDGWNDVIVSAQKALTALNYATNPNGFMDQLTVKELTNFQSNHKLITDGTLGQQSWSELRSSLIYRGKC